MPTFAQRLRDLREKAGLTQVSLADASGLPVGSIRNYEQGQREPHWQVVFRLAQALGVSCEAFADCLTAEESSTQPPQPADPSKAKAKAQPQQPKEKPKRKKEG